MYRKLIRRMAEWKEARDRRLMIVRGAGQVGKTWLMKKFGSDYYKNYVYIVLEEKEKIKNAFAEGADAEKIIEIMQEESGCLIEPNRTLIILDEIQQQPQMLCRLADFCGQAPQYHVMAAVSLPGSAMPEELFLKGRMDVCDLYPLDFEEFLYACGESRLAQMLHSKDRDMMGVFKDKYIDLLKYYYYVGGMPEAVKAFCRTKDLRNVRSIQERILIAYERDFFRYTDEETAWKMQALWRQIPVWPMEREMAERENGADETVLLRLMEAGLVYRVNEMTGNEPDLGKEGYGSYKLFLLDIGLMGTMLRLNARTILCGNTIFSEFKGVLTGQYVMQQLKGNPGQDIFYWISDTSNGEIDFLVQYEDGVVPVEIKVDGGRFVKNLKAYCNKYRPEMAVRTSVSDFHVKDWMINIPLYGIGLLRQYLA